MFTGSNNEGRIDSRTAATFSGKDNCLRVVQKRADFHGGIFPTRPTYLATANEFHTSQLGQELYEATNITIRDVSPHVSRVVFTRSGRRVIIHPLPRGIVL